MSIPNPSQLPPRPIQSAGEGQTQPVQPTPYAQPQQASPYENPQAGYQQTFGASTNSSNKFGENFLPEANRSALRKHALTQIITGIVIMVIGISITAFSYAASGGGGSPAVVVFLT